jgi:hypothetical protein
VRGKRRLSITTGIPPFFSQFTGQSTEVDSSSAGYESCIRNDAVLLLIVIHIYVILICDRTKSFARRSLRRTLLYFKRILE